MERGRLVAWTNGSYKETCVSPSLAKIAWPLCTERLTLRPVVDEDLPQIWSYRRLASVSRWVSRSIADCRAFRAVYGAPLKMSETIVIEHCGQVIGDLMIRIGDAWGQDEIIDQAQATQAELAWCLDPAYVGRGLATEAVQAQIRVCFEHLKLRRVVASCFAANEPSWRLMERWACAGKPTVDKMRCIEMAAGATLSTTRCYWMSIQLLPRG